MSNRRSIKSMTAAQLVRELSAGDHALTTAGLLEKEQKYLAELDRRRAGGTRRRGPGFVASIVQAVPTVEILQRGGPRRSRVRPGVCPVRVRTTGERCELPADSIDSGDRMRCAVGHVYRATKSENPYPTTSATEGSDHG